MAQGGQASKEYTIVKTNFHKIVTGLQQEGVLHEVAMKVFEKNLITPQRLRNYKDSSMASDFVMDMLTRIQLNRGDFHVFLSCLSTMPTLNNLTAELKALMEPGKGNGHLLYLNIV